MSSGALVLLAWWALIDPPREEAVAAVAACRAAGIRVKMITGDHAATARAIARQLGLDNSRRRSPARSSTRLDDAACAELAARADVFARASPEHKLRLVRGAAGRRARWSP